MKTNLRFVQFARYFALLLLGVAFFRLGYSLFFSSDRRGPAAVRALHEESFVSGGAQNDSVHDQLVSGLKTISAGQSVGMELGNFKIKSAQGQEMNVCEVYEKIEITFVAGGMAVSGHPPEMVLSGPCETSRSLKTIDPLLVDFERILATPVQDQKFEDPSNPEVSYTFHNVSDSWPREWILQRIRLVGPDADTVEMSANVEDFRRVLGNIPTLSWRR